MIQVLKQKIRDRLTIKDYGMIVRRILILKLEAKTPGRFPKKLILNYNFMGYLAMGFFWMEETIFFKRPVIIEWLYVHNYPRGQYNHTTCIVLHDPTISDHHQNRTMPAPRYHKHCPGVFV